MRIRGVYTAIDLSLAGLKIRSLNSFKHVEGMIYRRTRAKVPLVPEKAPPTCCNEDGIDIAEVLN